MFRRLKDFFAAHEQMAKNTQRVFALLTDENLEQRIAAGHRRLGDIAWHVVVTIPEMMQRTGLALSAVDAQAPPPAQAEAIRTAYARAAEELDAALRAQWNDASLEETDDLYGESWPRGLTLRILLDHQIHHLGQASVLLRQAGAVVPGIYGPAKEEWERLGMQTPPY